MKTVNVIQKDIHDLMPSSETIFYELAVRKISNFIIDKIEANSIYTIPDEDVKQFAQALVNEIMF